MASFVLVHGSGQHAGCWERVAADLVARGHAVAAPDLEKRDPELRWDDHARLVAASVTDPDTVVVAHSLCGALLPLVPAHRPCGLLVFLAAVVPEPGRSVRQQFTEDPGMFTPAWIASGSRWFDRAAQQALAREFLFHDADADALAFGLGTLDLLDTQALVVEPAPFAAWPDVPTASIVATADRTLTADWGRRTSRRVLGREPLEIAGGHCPQISRPVELAGILDDLARRRKEEGAGP